MGKVSFLLVLVCLCAVSATAKEIEVTFTGRASLVTDDMLDVTEEEIRDSRIAGTFTYDADVPDTDWYGGEFDSREDKGYYLHTTTGGLTLRIAGQEIACDGGILCEIERWSDKDWFQVYAGTDAIHDTGPLLLNGTEQDELKAFIWLIDEEKDALTSDDLPGSFPAEGFMHERLRDHCTVRHNGETLVWHIRTLNGVPEPTSLSVLFAGGIVVYRRRRW
jgi:hypothetical protein